MKVSNKIKYVLFAIIASLFFACADESSVSETIPIEEGESNAEIASHDTIEYVEPPSFRCEEIVAIQVEDSSGNIDWDYDYSISYLDIHDGGMMGFAAYNQINKVYQRKAADDVWTITSGIYPFHTPPCRVGSVVLGQNFTHHDYYEYELCRKDDEDEKWSCSFTDTTGFSFACDDYFYFLRGSTLLYSSDGIDWKPFSFGQEGAFFGGLGNAFMIDSLHYIYTGHSRLLWSKDLVTWDSAYVPVRQGATKVVYGNGVFVYAGAWSELQYSTDLKEWKKAKLQCPSCHSPWFSDIVFDKGVFFVVGSATEFSTTKIALASVNGVDFLEQPACGGADDFDKVYSDGKGDFYAMQNQHYSIFHRD